MLRILIAVSILLLFVSLPRSETASGIRRLTNTPEHTLNLNPSLSDDGRTVVFESSSDVFGNGGGAPSFHGIGADVFDGSFMEIARGRMVSAALSSDGRVIAFASTEDLVGQNPDRNSEIFVFDGPVLRQLTHPLKLTNAHPSISSDGKLIVFSSNGETQKISGDGSRTYIKRNVDLSVIDRETQVETPIRSAIPDLSLTEGRAVSNDGTRLVYSASVALNQTQVFLFDARDNTVRQLTQLGSRVTDVPLRPAISGDGKRVAFATRRRVSAASDGSVELYVLDLPTGQVQQVTNAPSSATAEVVASLNFAGSVIAFNFPRVLSGPVVDEDFANNSEIYVAALAPRAAFGEGVVLNAAALGQQPDKETRLAPGSIASFRGESLGGNVTVNGQAAPVFYASPTEVIFVVPENTAVGPGEIVVTNLDGFSTKAQALITSAAPGVFTASGDGKGEGIILDSDSITRGPFDPSNGQRRLSIFATGVRHATSVAVTIGGQSTLVETVARADLPGLDEVHVLLPVSLSGTGTTTLSLIADGVTSNPVSVVLGGVPPVSQDRVVISQIYGGGGNSGAPFRNDFIEIFNAGTTPVNLAGWSVQYASATASTWSSTSLTSVVLAPGQHYLIQQAGGNNGNPLPTPDATGTIAMAAGSGKVALVKNTTTLTGACPADASIVDLVGYGSTANCFRGTGPAPAASNTNAATRAANGCTDTRNNAADFALAPPNPRNTVAPFNTCTITKSVLPWFADAIARRRDRNFAPALRLRRFP
ncbi:MAG TPA: lamin tail domain-containing protein [Pyrinomonadaceae bacterium]|jgi:uncharacterized protein (TIGR03437 family)|nr:lamin tail domain-containing protein [Pyrinomonadaceae bacterium]